MPMRDRSWKIEHYRSVAHRGLHDNEGGIPENSLPAFARAAEAGLAVEFDVHITADGQLAVFHDSELKRMTGVPGILEEWSLADLQKLRLLGTEETIPTLDQVLEVVEGRVPMLIEIKCWPQTAVGRLEPVLLQRLLQVRGEFILESFNPKVLLWLRRYAPQYIRGQLGSFDPKYPKFAAFCREALVNPATRPDFVAFDIDDLDEHTCETCRKHQVPLLAWTVKTPQQLEKARRLCDGVIFESIEP